MSNRDVYTPKIEAKELFLQVQEGESFLFEYFFESYRPPDGISEEDQDQSQQLGTEPYIKTVTKYNGSILAAGHRTLYKNSNKI